MLSVNCLGAERERGCRFAEKFESATTVAKNRGTVTGIVPIDFGATFNGGANYTTYPAAGVFNQPAVSIAVEFYTSRTAGLINEYIIDTTAGALYRINFNAISDLVIWFNSVQAVFSPLATYTPYWKIGRNVIVATGITGNNALYLNGVSIATAATAWTVADPATLYVGARNAGLDGMIGKYTSLKIFAGPAAANLLTAQEARDHWNNSVF